MAKILAIRFSALGDVAMTVPVLYSFAQAYPQHQIVVLSRPFMKSLFANAPSNLTFRGDDVKKDYAGTKGLIRLFSELKAEKFDAVADLHDVLRSKFLRFCFRINGVSTARIDKNRKARKKLISLSHKALCQQPTSFERYTHVFNKLGYTFHLNFQSIYGNGKGDISRFESLAGHKQANDKWIGIAPFAAHQGKIYPLPLMEQVIQKLSDKENQRLFLFGGGPKEITQLKQWADMFPNTISIAGTCNMNQELALMSHLDIMLSMDSGNMHLASLVGTPVISIWGATHPFAGFMGWNQHIDNAVQRDLPCRPCSIFGNKPCHRKDYACLNEISPEQIIKKIEKWLYQD